MGISKQIREINPENDLHTCPVCGYEYGFHVSFMEIGSPGDGHRIILICPNCGARYDPGWKVSIDR